MSRIFFENGSTFIDRITFLYPGFDRAQHPVLMQKANANLFYFICCYDLVQKGLLDESGSGAYPDLYQVYYQGFTLLFGERMDFYSDSIKPQLEVITASCEPIETEIVSSAVTDGKLFGLMDQDHLFASLFEIYREDNREVIRFAENAFANWLLSPDLTREFRVDQVQGNQRLSDWCHFVNFSPSAGDTNGYCARWGLHHHHLAGNELRCGMEMMRRKQIQDGKFKPRNPHVNPGDQLISLLQRTWACIDRKDFDLSIPMIDQCIQQFDTDPGEYFKVSMLMHLLNSCCHFLSSGLIIQHRYEEAHPFMIRGIDYLLIEIRNMPEDWVRKRYSERLERIHTFYRQIMNYIYHMGCRYPARTLDAFLFSQLDKMMEVREIFIQEPKADLKYPYPDWTRREWNNIMKYMGLDYQL